MKIGMQGQSRWKQVVGLVKKLNPYNYIFFACKINKHLHANLQ